jgi:hypothetical protein
MAALLEKDGSPPFEVGSLLENVLFEARVVWP